MKHLLSIVAAALVFVVAATSALAQPAGTLRASVVDREGRVVAGARLNVLELDRGATSAEKTGRLTLAGLPPGRYDAELVADGHPVQAITFEISMGRLTDLGRLVVGAEPGAACTTLGLYRDVGTIRTVSYDLPDDSIVRSIAFRVTKSCE